MTPEAQWPIPKHGLNQSACHSDALLASDPDAVANPPRYGLWHRVSSGAKAIEPHFRLACACVKQRSHAALAEREADKPLAVSLLNAVHDQLATLTKYSAPLEPVDARRRRLNIV